MFGAPDLPRRAPPPAQRKPGVGDHVTSLGQHIGLIVDIQPGGFAVIARRHAGGRTGVLESEMLVDRLRIAPVTPLAFDEVVDPEWRRGLG